MTQERLTPQPDISRDVEAIAGIESVPVILKVLNDRTGMRFSAVARVTSERWIACAAEDAISFGLQAGDELEARTTICDEVRQVDELVVINDVQDHPVYSSHPAPKRHGFRSYISVPIYTRSGDFFGTLCSLDPEPSQVNTPQIIQTFELFAELIGLHLKMQRQLTSTQDELASALADADVRDQFIAVLGHDLRNPLAAISGSAAVLERNCTDSSSKKFVKLIRSSAARMSGLVDNILDLARGQLGGGIPVERAYCTSLPDTLLQVIDELQEANADSDIDVHIDVSQPIYCDPVRIAQLFSNLLANAITHGDNAQPIRVSATIDDGQFELTIRNHGQPIPADVGQSLFRPFGQPLSATGEQGLGLGLFIASEIAESHEGSLSFKSSDARTQFTFRMPISKTDP